MIVTISNKLLSKSAQISFRIVWHLTSLPKNFYFVLINLPSFKTLYLCYSVYHVYKAVNMFSNWMAFSFSFRTDCQRQQRFSTGNLLIFQMVIYYYQICRNLKYRCDVVFLDTHLRYTKGFLESHFPYNQIDIKGSLTSRLALSTISPLLVDLFGRPFGTVLPARIR